MTTQIVIATTVDDELMAAVERLMPQLTSSAPPPSREQLADVIATQDLFIARTGAAAIVGMGTLVTYRTPVGVHCWIEDVVVDDAARGQGAGEALTRAMIERARDKGARSLALTSNPRRDAANRLYQRLGFAPWPTNLYRMSFG
jgi:ribosomal protein S18 acetylase RimI-like enzyme